MKEKLNIKSDCSNFHNMPSVKIVLPYIKDYYSKPIVTGIATTSPDEINNAISGKPVEEDTFEIELNAEDFIIDGKKVKKNKEEFKDFIEQDLQCHPAFMAIDVPAPRGPLFVFGEYFLRKFYTVFDRDRLLLGLAESKEVNDKINEIIITPYDEEISNKQNNNKIISNELENKIKNHKGIVNISGEVEHTFFDDNEGQDGPISLEDEWSKKETNFDLNNLQQKEESSNSDFENFMKSTSFLGKELNLELN